MRKLNAFDSGWFPSFSPDGKHLTFGFGKGVGWCTTSANAEVKWVEPKGFQSGWFDNENIIYQREPKVGDPGIYLWNIKTNTRKKISDLIGSNLAGSLGHWALNQPTKGKTYYDGKELPYGDLLGVDLWGEHLLTSQCYDKARDKWQLLHFINGKLHRTIRTPTGHNAWNFQHGYLGYGYFGRTNIVTPDTQFKDSSVAPIPPKGVVSGEGVAQFGKDGAGNVWVLTSGEIGNEVWMALRPLWAKDAIKIPYGAVAPALHLEGNRALCAGNYTNGKLELWEVDIREPRTLFTLPVTKPTEPAEPKPPAPPPAVEEPKEDMSYQLEGRELEVYQDVLRRLGAKFPEWRKSKNDDERRLLAEAICQTLKAKMTKQFGKALGDLWGWKSAHSNFASPSKDASARVLEGTPTKAKRKLAIFDMVNGTTREMNLSGKGEVSEQYFIPVPAKDWLDENVPQPEPPKEEPPKEEPKPPVVECKFTPCNCDAKVAELKEEIASIKTLLEEFVTRPAPTYEGKVLGWTVRLEPK